ncbi:hypothetical protein JRQ81_004147 [Phrynocephalus forsythii]|uniref:Ig-like domain-containing protein n=1 Tax=Phrynocephalus forsythii TaxID=171643 RepID=A0A9Q1AY41_9SAUR|nr:hypothetical protein JRQ81_004147 [Phrynocephalus forsythii]
MSKCLAIAFLLLTSFHLGLPKEDCVVDDKDGDNDGDGVTNVPKNVIPCSERASKLKIYSPSSETTIGGNVTLECELTTNCLPIKYILFFKKDKIKGLAIKKKAEEKIVFKLTISSRNELGEYKCKAQYIFNDKCDYKYSIGFHFTLKASPEDKNKLVVLIIVPLLLFLLLLTVVTTFPLLILPWCTTKKGMSPSKSKSYLPANNPGQGNTGIYEDVAHGNDDTIEYCELDLKVKTEDGREEMLTEDTSVTYAEIK